MEPHVIHQKEFEQIIAKHIAWHLSDGTVGEQADFQGKFLEDISLVGRPTPTGDYPTLSDISFRGATIRNLHMENIYGIHLDFSDVAADGLEIVTSTLEDCKALNSDTNCMRLQGVRLLRLDARNSNHFKPSIEGIHMVDSNCHASNLVKPLMMYYNDIEKSNLSEQSISGLSLASQEDSQQAQLVISDCDTRYNSWKDCAWGATKFLRDDLSSSSISRNDFNGTIFDKTPLNHTVTGKSFFEETTFINSPPLERMKQYSYPMKSSDDVLNVAIYPMVNKCTCRRLFRDQRLEPQQAVDLLRQVKPDSPAEKKSLDELVSCFQYIQRHMNTWKKEFSKQTPHER